MILMSCFSLSCFNVHVSFFSATETFSMESVSDPDKWREIAAQKEKEWKQVTEQR